MILPPINPTWLTATEFGPAVLRLRLLETQLILRKANLPAGMRERAEQAARALREAIVERPCGSRADFNAKLNLLLETGGKAPQGVRAEDETGHGLVALVESIPALAQVAEQPAASNQTISRNAA